MGGLILKALGLGYIRSPQKALQIRRISGYPGALRKEPSLVYGKREQPSKQVSLFAKTEAIPSLKPAGKIYVQKVYSFLGKLISMDDIFDSSLNLEESHLKEGYAEGYRDGLVAGKEEAKQVGLKVGFEVGEELGFYRGCVDVWNSAIRVDPDRFSIRVRKSVKQMEELLEKYPLQDPENEKVQELMGGLRLKFKAISATLGVKLEYNGYPKLASDGKEIEF